MIVLFIVVSTTTLSAFAVHRQWLLQSDLEARFDQTRTEILAGLAQNLAQPVWALNANIMRIKLESTLVHPEVVGACILSPDAQEIYARVRRGATAQDTAAPNAPGCTVADPRAVQGEAEIYPPAGIDAERRTRAIGKTVVYLSRTHMHATLHAAMIRGVTEVAVIDVVLVLMLTFSLRTVFRPLEDLRGALFKLASNHGDHLEELPRLGRTEFDSVIDGFNRVLRRLKRIIAQRTDAEITALTAIQTTNHAYAQIQATQRELLEKNRQLEALSMTDQLTGVFNRRWLDEVLTSELERSRCDGGRFSIILIDVDRFKSVNDTHGHQVGDQVLIEFAGRIRAAKRAADTVGRWGGEEFLLICPDTGLHDAVPLAEALRRAVAEHDFNMTGRMTASLGVACVQPRDTIHGMMSRADNALYRCKKNGRDRVEFAADGDARPR